MFSMLEGTGFGGRVCGKPAVLARSLSVAGRLCGSMAWLDKARWLR